MKTVFRAKEAMAMIVAMIGLVMTPSAGHSEQRCALVIGNNAYKHTRPLLNPVNDAKAVAAALEQLGFRVSTHTDAKLRTMKEALRDFVHTIPKNGVALVYFAGHGVQIDGANYLVPIDAEMRDTYEVPDETLPMDMTIRALKTAESALNILILDCCRDDPFSRSWRSGRSIAGAGFLVPREMPQGMFIAYATSPGKVAQDGEGQHSPYTEALLEELGKSSTPFESMFKAVGGRVFKTTSGKQEPWFNSKFYGEFMFLPPGRDQLTSETDQPSTQTAPPMAQETGALQSPLPERGFFSLQQLYDGTPYDAYNESSKKSILERAQQKLKNSGVYTAGIDGVMGPATQDAIIAWQRQSSLPVTGMLDSESQRGLGLENIPEKEAPKPKAPSPRAARKPSPRPSSSSGSNISVEEFLRRARALKPQ